MNDKQVGERVTILTKQERIDGTHVRMRAVRLSDSFTMMDDNGQGFVKLTDATVSCRASGRLLARSAFVLVVWSQITLIGTEMEPEAGRA